MAYTITGEQKLVHLRRFLEKLDKKSKIIDVGGTRHDLDFFREAGFSNVYVSNNSDKELEGCGENGINFDITQKIPAHWQEHFDVVVCMDVIEHLINPDYALANLNRLLKKEGHLILTTPNLASVLNRLFLLAGWSLPNYHPAFIKTGNPLGKVRVSTNFRNSYAHKSVFTYAQLREFVEAYGFTITQTHGYDYGSFKSDGGGGSYAALRKGLDKILPTSWKEGTFIAARKVKLVEVEEAIRHYSKKG